MFLISIRYTSRSRWRRVVQSLVTALQIRLPSGYLGTIQALSDFRTTLTNFSDNEGWPRYKGEDRKCNSSTASWGLQRPCRSGKCHREAATISVHSSRCIRNRLDSSMEHLHYWGGQGQLSAI